MMRSKYHLYRQLIALLMEYSGIVDAFQQKSAMAPALLSAWTRRAEDLLSTHRLPEAARIAGVRARMMNASAVEDRPGFSRKRQFHSAIACLEDFQQCLQDALQPLIARVDLAREGVRKLLQIIAQSGTVRYDKSKGFEAFCNVLWNIVSGHEQLKAQIVQLKTLLPADDLRLVLADEVDLNDFIAKKPSKPPKKKASARESTPADSQEPQNP
jgi:hypothetical protein